jgi:hypothetical protein
MVLKLCSFLIVVLLGYPRLHIYVDSYSIRSIFFKIFPHLLCHSWLNARFGELNMSTYHDKIELLVMIGLGRGPWRLFVHSGGLAPL